MQYDSFLGKYAIGRINRGKVTKNMQVVLIKNETELVKSKVDNFVYRGLEKEEVNEAGAGDIVALTSL